MTYLRELKMIAADKVTYYNSKKGDENSITNILTLLNHNYMISHQCYGNRNIEITNKIDTNEFFENFNWYHFNEIYKKLDKRNKEEAEKYFDKEIIQGTPSSSFDINLIKIIYNEYNKDNFDEVNKKLNTIMKDKYAMLYLEHIIEYNNKEFVEYINKTLTNNNEFINSVFKTIENRNYFNNFIKYANKCINENDINKSLIHLDYVLSQYNLNEINKIILGSQNKLFLINLIPTNILLKMKYVNYLMLIDEVTNDNFTLTDVYLSNDFLYIDYFLINLIMENKLAYNCNKLPNTNNNEYILTIIAAEEEIKETNDFDIVDEETGYPSEWQIVQLENAVYGYYLNKLSIINNINSINDIIKKININKYFDIMNNFINMAERVNKNKNKRKTIF